MQVVNRRRAAAWLLSPVLGGWAVRAQAEGDLTHRPWPAREPAPQLTLDRWEGSPWSLAAQQGKPVLLNFWASWCEPCRSEMPSLELLATRHEAQGLQVLAVNHRETDAAVRRFMEATALSLPVLRDRDGGAAKAFGVRTFPSTVAINRRGQVLSIAIGECDWASPAARQWVAAAL
jgi:thiol-disulfide isomerase/thioredoxin